jgi:hypothetical protein
VSNLSHPIATDGGVVIVNFEDSRQTEIHARGCKHALKGYWVIEREPGTEPTPHDGYDDDWYKVAPCARKARQ